MCFGAIDCISGQEGGLAEKRKWWYFWLREKDQEPKWGLAWFGFVLFCESFRKWMSN